MELDLKDGMHDGKIVTYYKNGQKKRILISKGVNLQMESGLGGMKMGS